MIATIKLIGLFINLFIVGCSSFESTDLKALLIKPDEYFVDRISSMSRSTMFLGYNNSVKNLIHFEIALKNISNKILEKPYITIILYDSKNNIIGTETTEHSKNPIQPGEETKLSAHVALVKDEYPDKIVITPYCSSGKGRTYASK